MANRKRSVQMKFYITEEEKRLIDEKMAQLPTRRYGAYLGYQSVHRGAFRHRTEYQSDRQADQRRGLPLSGGYGGNPGRGTVK